MNDEETSGGDGGGDIDIDSILNEASKDIEETGEADDEYTST